MATTLDVMKRHTAAAPVDVFAIAKDLGIRVVERDMGDDSGKIERTADGSFLITLNSRHGPNRKRFTLAHEIAHYVLHRSMIGVAGEGILDNAMYRSAKGDAVERQANNYAASILMPGPLVVKKWASGARNAEALAAEFRVSVPVAEIRIREIGFRKSA